MDDPTATPFGAWAAWDLAYGDTAGARALAQAQVEAGGAAQGHGWLALALLEARSGDGGLAIEALRRARAVWAAPLDDHALALCDEVLAIQLRRSGDAAASMRLQRDIDARAVPGMRPYDRFISHNSRAITHKRVGCPEDALRHFYAAADAAQLSGLPGARITALCNLGAHHNDFYNLEEARSLCLQALQTAQQVGTANCVAIAAANLVVIHHAAGHPAQARAMVDVLVALTPSIGALALQQRALPIALGHFSVGEVERAQHCLDQAARNAQPSGNALVFSAWLQARCWLKQGLAERARELAERTLKQRAAHKLIDPPYDLMELHRVAADACEACDDMRAALDFVRRAQTLYEQLVGRSARARLIALQAGHELLTAQRERDLAVDSRDRAESDQQRLTQLNEALKEQFAQTQALHARLQEQAVRDPLTGLHNRRHLFEVAPGLLELARRNGRPLCVVLIDLDHFKLLNDTFGHQAGDTVLQRFSTLLPLLLRRSDVICRHGGEEFVAVMPDIDADGADAVLCRLLAEYQTPWQETGSRRLPSCSFSAGIAIFPTHGHTLEQLLSRADRALYRAKSLGRARIEKAPGTDFSVLV